MFDKRGLFLQLWKAGDHQKGKLSFSGMEVMKSDSARRSLTDMCTVFSVPKRSPLRHSRSRSFRMKVSIMEHNEPMICSLVSRNFAWQRSSPSSREGTLHPALDSSAASWYQKDGIKLGLPNLLFSPRAWPQENLSNQTQERVYVLLCIRTKLTVLSAEGNLGSNPRLQSSYYPLATHMHAIKDLAMNYHAFLRLTWN